MEAYACADQRKGFEMSNRRTDQALDSLSTERSEFYGLSESRMLEVQELRTELECEERKVENAANEITEHFITKAVQDDAMFEKVKHHEHSIEELNTQMAKEEIKKAAMKEGVAKQEEAMAEERKALKTYAEQLTADICAEVEKPPVRRTTLRT